METTTRAASQQRLCQRIMTAVFIVKNGQVPITILTSINIHDNKLFNNNKKNNKNTFIIFSPVLICSTGMYALMSKRPRSVTRLSSKVFDSLFSQYFYKKRYRVRKCLNKCCLKDTSSRIQYRKLCLKLYLIFMWTQM